MWPYYRVFANSVAVGLAYRWSVVTGVFTRLLQLVVTLFVWRSIFATSPEIQGYTVDEMSAYLVLTALMSIVFSSSHFFRLSDLVRKGTLNAYLVRPYSFLGDSLAVFLGGKVVEAIVIVAAVLLLHASGAPVLEHASPAVLALLCSNLLLSFLVGSVVGALSFWLVEMWPIKPLYASLMALLGGTMFPLDLLPPAIGDLVQATPFALFGFVNTRALQGALSTREIAAYLAVSLLWNATCAALYQLLWRRGLRRYEAVNG
ncbi:ABC transporter permease [Sorangium sp. So ce118]